MQLLGEFQSGPRNDAIKNHCGTKCSCTANPYRNSFFSLLFVELGLNFVQQVIFPLLLVAPEKGSRDFPAQAAGVHLQEHKSVAHQPQTSQQHRDSVARGRGRCIAERRLGVEGPLVCFVEVGELPLDTGLWDQAQSRQEPPNLKNKKKEFN